MKETLLKTVRRRTASARFAGSKTDLLLAGAAVSSLTYERASKALTMKSVDDQRHENLKVNSRTGWTLMGSYTDNDIGASERTDDADRGEWTRLIEHIETGNPGDVLIVCDISRETRDLAVYVKMRDLCRRAGLVFWMVAGTLYDLRDKNDQLALGMQAVVAEHTSNAIKENIIRTLASNARAGVPQGKAPYGFLRRYDERTGRYASQHPDDEPARAGLPVRVTVTGEPWTPAGVVRGIYTDLLAGKSLLSIADRLNELGIPAPRLLAAIEKPTPKGVGRWDGTEVDKHGRQRRPALWASKTVREIALNPANIGQRWSMGYEDEEPRLTREGCWDSIIGDEQFFAVASLLLDPRRKSAGPQAHAINLCVGIVRCGECGEGLVAMNNPKKIHRRATVVYKCRSSRGCAACNRDDLDEYVTGWVLTWLTADGRLDRLNAVNDSANANAAAARADAERLRRELDVHLAKLDDTTEPLPIGFDRRSRVLQDALDAADLRARTVGLSASLRPFVGKPAAEVTTLWYGDAERRGLDLTVKRTILRDLVSITLFPAGKGRRGVPIEDRVKFAALMPE